MKRPLEFYGRSTSNTDNPDWQRILARQRCPFLDRKCIKQRKSDPEQTIGACIVGYQDKSLIVCPKRFLEGHRVFLDSLGLLTAFDARFVVVPEVAMPGGSVDYFVVAMRGDEVIDYLGLEIQSLDTTGSGAIWEAREDLSDGRFKEKYDYGMNWKMSAKTILIQLHHKAESFEALGKRLVLVLQEEFHNYIRREFQTMHFHSARIEDSVHIHAYDCVDLDHRLRLRLSVQSSTDVSGVERMLKLGKGAAIVEQEVLRRIKAKLPRGVTLSV